MPASLRRTSSSPATTSSSQSARVRGSRSTARARPSFRDPAAGWLALPLTSTLAGDLTITGSVANIIVVERAAADGGLVGFAEYFRVGLPVTLATLVLGVTWAWLMT